MGALRESIEKGIRLSESNGLHPKNLSCELRNLDATQGFTVHSHVEKIPFLWLSLRL